MVRDGEIYVLGRDQITRLRDRNGDGEADEYACFSQQIDTSTAGHDFVTSLQADDAGSFYYVDPLGVHRFGADGRVRETLGTGWRNPNGMSGERRRAGDHGGAAAGQLDAFLGDL